jgi:predicted AAA+ superfamily ATPase
LGQQTELGRQTGFFHGVAFQPQQFAAAARSGRAAWQFARDYAKHSMKRFENR